MAVKPEQHVKNIIKKWLDARNINYWMVQPSPFGTSTGMSDFICMLPKSGQFLAIEAKAKGKKSNVTPKQQKFLDTVNENGGYGFVVDSQEDLDTIGVILYGKVEMADKAG